MYSNPALIRLRSALRAMGILRLIQTSPVYGWISQGYESRFDAAMMASLKPGMRVFDIGANVGYYTQKFAEAVGPTGEVHAFEPVPASAAKVRELQQQYSWIHVHQCAVADQPGEVEMSMEGGSTSPNHMITIGEPSGGQSSLKVPVHSIDELSSRIGVPNMVKIDVEGYEWHVLQGGGGDTLPSPGLKHVFVEIHFKLLERRGMANAAVLIQQLLESKGFSVAYTDFSHLHAWKS
jgi:FkbM family methyltransferase